MSLVYVLPYVNPDTDGVCSAIAYAYWCKSVKKEDALPIIFGKPDRETLFVLKHLDIGIPSTLDILDDSNRYIVVDTHQKNQLPENFPYGSVEEILDHHPTGDDNAFPNARIHNEQIGAVATYIAELYQQNNQHINKQIATLLYSAIISNTLDLNAPTTNDRDISMVDWLLSIVELPQNYVDQMFVARSDISDISTIEILYNDYKEFDFSGSKVGMSQLETTDFPSFINRKDIFEAIERIVREKNLDHFVFICADIRYQKGALVVVSPRTKEIISTIIPGAKFHGNIAHFDRILLRKSDVIPQFKEFFSSNPKKANG